MNKRVLRKIKGIKPGALICAEWLDASVGKSLSQAGIDVPVKSWGVFLGLLGERGKHIVLAQNSFRYADGLYDIDYTAIPLTWTVDVVVIDEHHIPPSEAEQLLRSFLTGGRRTFPKHISQQRVVNHEGVN